MKERIMQKRQKRRSEGRKFVKVSFKPEKKRTDKWTLKAWKKRPDEWIEGGRKNGWKRTAEKGKQELTFERTAKKETKWKKSQKTRKKFKKGLQFPGK